jgi:ribose transport system substrate-binding protein
VKKILVAVIFFALISCKSTPAGNRITIAAIPKGTTHEFWKSIHKGINQAATELDVDVIWKGPLKEDNREEQIKVIEDFITRGVSGIVLSPLDETALRPSVTNAVRSGIPVVIMDSGLKSDDYISFVATDNYQGGIMAAKYLAELLNENGKAAMLRYTEGSNSTVDREVAFMDEMKKHPGIDVVSSNQYTGVTTEGAYKASENLLASLKDSEGNLKVDGIFTSCEPVAFGMLRALEDGALVKKVKLIGFDSTDKMAAALKAGEFDALVLQDPVKIGYLSIKTMVSHLRGEKVEKRIDTGVKLITPKNLSDPENDRLLYPLR